MGFKRLPANFLLENILFLPLVTRDRLVDSVDPLDVRFPTVLLDHVCISTIGDLRVQVWLAEEID
jgi:hypothetical protein